MWTLTNTYPLPRAANPPCRRPGFAPAGSAGSVARLVLAVSVLKHVVDVVQDVALLGGAAGGCGAAAAGRRTARGRAVAFRVAVPVLRHGRLVRARLVGQQPGQVRADQAAELTVALAAPVQDRDLQLGRGQLAGLGAVAPERRDGRAQGRAEVSSLGVAALEHPADLVGRAADDHEAVRVGHRAVVGEPVDLVLFGPVADLGDDQLHLIGLAAGL